MSCVKQDKRGIYAVGDRVYVLRLPTDATDHPDYRYEVPANAPVFGTVVGFGSSTGRPGIEFDDVAVVNSIVCGRPDQPARCLATLAGELDTPRGAFIPHEHLTPLVDDTSWLEAPAEPDFSVLYHFERRDGNGT